MVQQTAMQEGKMGTRCDVKSWGKRYVIAATLIALVAGVMPGWWNAPVATAQNTSLDLAAVIMHPDDLDWYVEEQEYEGQLDNAPYIIDGSTWFTTVDEVLASPYYVRGRGGFLPSASESVDLADLLEESGWVRTVDAFMVRQATTEGSWMAGVGVSIEEYDSDDGAETAFASFIDPTSLAEIAQADDIESLDPPNVGDEAAMWSYQSLHWASPAIPVVTLWVRVDNYIVSLSSVDASGITEPDPALVERLMEYQLKRLEHAEHLYQPGLAACAPRLAGDRVWTLSDDYILLNGKGFAFWSETYDDLAEAQARDAEDGIVDRHRVRQAIVDTSTGATDGVLYYTVFTRAFAATDRATVYMDDLESVLEEEGRNDIAELDDVPSLGVAARAFTYVGNSGSPSTVVYVQVDNLVYSVYLGPSTEPLPDPAYELAEAYLDRLASGDCAEPL
jgi:hypothetical protein